MSEALEQAAPDAEKKQGPVRYWLGEIAAARKREKDFRKDGRRVLDIYNGKKVDSIPFNILYSNTETLVPALYNNTPRPVVQRRFKDENPLGKAAAMLGQRSLEYLLDTNSEEYASFDSVMHDAVLDAVLPGRGATRCKYDYESGKTKRPSGEEIETVTYETVCYESLKWDRWTHGYAKKWVRIPWLAIEHDVTKQEATDLFGAKMAAKLKYTAVEATNDEEKGDNEKPEPENGAEGGKTTKIWEIWDRAGGRKVRFIAECYFDGFLKVDDDPLELTGFFPIPEPLRLFQKSNDLMPVSLYKLYENQAKELNRITVRINRVVEACKVRGVYDSTLGEIAGVLKQDDNQMVGAENVAALQNGGLDKAIWLMPIEKLISVLQQLYVAREACKRTIYEITGLSDILRGASAASETLGAQEIKQEWATLRLKRAQKEVQRYVRDLLRITLEIAAKKFKPDTFKQITGLPFPTTLEKEAAAGQMAAARASGAPQPPPQAVQVMSQPSWDQVQEALRDDTQRQYLVDIETNSTVDLEATEDKKDLAEIMNAISQFLNGVGPMVENGTMPFEVAKSMLLGIVRRFRFGTEIEDQIKAMQPPQPKEDPAVMKAKVQGEVDKAKAAGEMEVMQMELQIKKEELQLKREEMQAKKEYNVLMQKLKMVEAQNKINTAVAMSQIPAQPKLEPSKKAENVN